MMKRVGSSLFIKITRADEGYDMPTNKVNNKSVSAENTNHEDDESLVSSENKVNNYWLINIDDTGGHEIAENNNVIANGNRDKLLASSIEGKLRKESSLPTRRSIFRIPNLLRKHNEKVFVPNLVSIGPFHHGKKNLQAMQETKLWYLHLLLQRKPTPDTNLEYFVKVIRSTEQYYRNCYEEKFDDLSSDQFVEMMVLDGCFLIELFKVYAGELTQDKDDPVWAKWVILALLNDLLLLENQIPWRVLECLFDITWISGRRTLPDLALNFFYSWTFEMSPEIDGVGKNLHLLDFIRNCLIRSFDENAENTKSFSWQSIPSVTELLQAGVKFKRGKDNDMLNVTFKDGVMEIPPIRVQENGESLFRNLIAFEQCEPNIINSTTHISSYAFLMDNLINSSKDIEFLVEKEIMQTFLSSEDTASFFNRLNNDAEFSSFSYGELFEKVTQYHQGRWHRWQTILGRDYFSNPWSIISFVAALVILALTFIQTVYSILSYKYK